MEPAGLVLATVGLIQSLENSLRIIRRYASHTKISRASFQALEEDSQLVHRALSSLEDSLRAEQPEVSFKELNYTLERTMRTLDELKDGTNKMKLVYKFRTRPAGYQSRLHGPDVDLEAVLLSIDHARSVTSILHRTTVNHVSRSGQRMEKGIYDHMTGGLGTGNAAMLSMQSRDIRLRSHFESPPREMPPTETERLFKWMRPPSGQDKIHSQCRSDRLSGTCKWFQQTPEYDSWTNEPFNTGHRGSFWCNGRPGVGKTILCSSVIDHLNESQEANQVVFFYMGDSNFYPATEVASSLLLQLCVPRDRIPESLLQAYRTHHGKERPRLDDILNAIRETSQHIEEKCVAVIDALDESNMKSPTEASGFTKLLLTLSRTPWKVLAFGRPNIQSFSDGFKRDTYRYEIASKDTTPDIRLLVENAIKNSHIKEIIGNDKILKDLVITTLIEKARGMFHWVGSQIQNILDQTSIAGIKRVLEHSPDRLPGITNSLWKDTQEQAHKRASLARRTLAFLSWSRSRVTSAAVRHLLAFSEADGSLVFKDHLDFETVPRTESILLESCMGLVNVDPCSDVITISHFDIAQHLRENWNDYFTYKDRIALAFVLVNYLLLPDFKNPSATRDGLKYRMEVYPLYAYACSYWGSHVQDAYHLLKNSSEEYREQIDALRSRVGFFLEESGSVASASQVASFSETELQDIASNGGVERLYLHPAKSVSSIQVAARYGLIYHAADLLDADLGSLNRADCDNVTPLHEAARAGSYDFVELLLKRGCVVHPSDRFGQTPLHYAARAGHTRIVDILQNEEPILPKLVRRDSPLAQAAQNGHSKTVHSLARSASWDEVQHAICEAAETGNTDTIETLLKNQNRVFLENKRLVDSSKDGLSALILALNGNHHDAVKTLLKNGADPNFTVSHDSDKTALHYAIEQDRVEIAKLLLDYGADINAHDTSSRNALFGAVGLPDTRAASLLLSNGIDIESSTDENGHSILHSAVVSNSTDLLSLLLDQGLSVADGDSPLLNTAARYGHYRAAELILNTGADVDSRGPSLVTPLMQAADGGHSSLCKLLISKRSNVGAQDKDGNTPLMHAVKSKDVSTVTLLIFEGQINICNHASENALTRSKALQHKEIEGLLRRHGAREPDIPIDIEKIGIPGPYHAGARSPGRPLPYPLDDYHWSNPKSAQSMSSDHTSEDRYVYPQSIDESLDEPRPLAPTRSFTVDRLQSGAKPVAPQSKRRKSVARFG